MVQDDVRNLLVADPLPEEWFRRSAADPGLFDSSSVAWRIHGHRAGLIGGLRALLLQTVHPLAMAGVAQHSDYRHDPWGRLHRTGGFIAVTTYGTTSAAEAAIATVRTVHEHVRGVTSDGRPYEANDPHLLAWVHNTELDSFLRAYQRYGGGDLDASDMDRYVAEMAQIGERLGMIEPPRSKAELRQALIAFRPELHATPEARDAVRFLLWPPLPAYLRPAYGVLAAAAVGMLPAFVRRQLLLPTAPLADPLVVRPAVRLLMGALGATLGADPPARRLVEEQAEQVSSAEVGSPTPAARRSPRAPQAHPADVAAPDRARPPRTRTGTTSAAAKKRAPTKKATAAKAPARPAARTRGSRPQP